MLDAAEVILRDQGYAALTSRNVAEQTGVKQRLVYYYFRTMDDLIRDTFKRLSIRELARLKEAASSERPLHEIWRVCINTSDARLISEFMALSYRDDGIRNEVITFIEESRKIQTTALKKTFAKADSTYSPSVIAIIATSLALALNREAALGVKSGHAAANKAIKDFFTQIEPQ